MEEFRRSGLQRSHDSRNQTPAKLLKIYDRPGTVSGDNSGVLKICEEVAGLMKT